MHVKTPSNIMNLCFPKRFLEPIKLLYPCLAYTELLLTTTSIYLFSTSNHVTCTGIDALLDSCHFFADKPSKIIQYNFLRRNMRLATHATSCDSDTRFTIFFMFATSSCTSSTMQVHCTCTQGRNCTPFVYVACRMSQKLNFLQLLRQVHWDSLRQLATGSFLSQLSQIACRIAESCIVNRPLVHKFSASTLIFGTFGASVSYLKFQYTEQTLIHMIQKGTSSLFLKFLFT